MRKHFPGLLVVMWLLPGIASAADSDGAFAVKGVGLTRCSDYVAAIQETRKEQIAMYVGWIGGFMTASNQNQEQTFDLAPWQNVRTLSSALMGFCDKNADMRFAEATARLAASLRRDRLVSRTELVAVRDDEMNHFVYKETLRRVQASLAERGLFTGDVSGEFDDATRSALKTFQTEQELPVSGLPDQRTLFTLFRDGDKN